ncbi:MAG: hypothetical protein AB7I27_03275 [Bacteriovoracaceae bacterium]
MSVKELEASVSIERLRNCALKFEHRTLVGVEFWQFQKKDLYECYMFNERVSKEIRYILAQFEVLLRNKVDQAYSNRFGVDWITNGKVKFSQDEIISIKEAERRIRKNGKTITHQRLIAKLSFGFWSRLFNSPYSQITSGFKDQIFPRNSTRFVKSPLTMSEIRDRLVSLNKMRNKVSHQEFILDAKYEVSKVHQDCIDLMNLMSKGYYSIFYQYDHFKKEHSDFQTYRSAFLADPSFSDFK